LKKRIGLWDISGKVGVWGGEKYQISEKKRWKEKGKERGKMAARRGFGSVL